MPEVHSLFSQLQFNKCNFSRTYVTLLHPADMRSLFHTVDHLSLDVVEADRIYKYSFVNVLYQHQEPDRGNKSERERTILMCVLRWDVEESGLTLGSYV